MAKWSIGKKLFITTGLLTALIACLGALAIVSLSRVQGNMDTSAGYLTDRKNLIAQINDAVQDAFISTNGSLLDAVLDDNVSRSKRKGQVQAALKRVIDLIGKMPPLSTEASRQALDHLRTSQAAWLKALVKLDNLAIAKQVAHNEVNPLYDGMVKDGDLISNESDQMMKDLRASGEQTYAAMRWTIIGVIAIGLAMGLLTFWMVRGLVATLRRTVTELNTGGNQVSSASTQIASTSQTLSQGASEQAASIEEVSASMEEMTAMARRNGDSSAEATSMMSETAKQVERSNVALADMVASMSAIKASSEKVAKINKTIDEIAFQTNILALNAAVEAARAGEAGMGFAVVADEVRNLAQRSAVAAKDTASLIEESISNSNQGAQRLEQVSTAIRGITDSAGKVKALLDEVNESSKQQGQGITQVSTAIQQVSTVTQTSAASAEESAAAAEELNAQSQNVLDLVNVLAVLVEGESAAKQTTVRPRSKAPGSAGGPKALKPHVVKRARATLAEDPFPMEPEEPGSFRSF